MNRSKRIAIIHFLPLEYYPPVTNAFKFLSGVEGLSIFAFSTHNLKDRKTFVADKARIWRYHFPDTKESVAIRLIKLGVWGKVDTSDISILFEKNEFEDFDKKNTSMIVTVVKLCRKHKKRILILSYEDIFSYKTQDERISYVADRLNETLKTCLTSPAPHYIEHFKQDRSPLNRNIQNYSIMKMYLEKQGLGVLMNENSDAYKQRLPFIEEILKEQ